MAKITVTIKNGKAHFDVDGVEGQGCEALTQAFIDALGGDIEDVQRKPEYYVELDHMEQHLYEE